MKVLMELGGNLKYQLAAQTLRLIGGRFFHEFQTGKTSMAKTKVYDTFLGEEAEGGNFEDTPDRHVFLANHHPTRLLRHC